MNNLHKRFLVEVFMKYIVALVISFTLVLSGFQTFAQEAETQMTSYRYTEHLENDLYIEYVLYAEPAWIGTEGSISGSKIGTIYDKNDVYLGRVTVTGSFTYTGTSATATGAGATVSCRSGATITTKSAYVAGSSAYAYAVIRYGGRNYNCTVGLTCDGSGNLS